MGNILLTYLHPHADHECTEQYSVAGHYVRRYFSNLNHLNVSTHAIISLITSTLRLYSSFKRCAKQ